VRIAGWLRLDSMGPRLSPLPCDLFSNALRRLAKVAASEAIDARHGASSSFAELIGPAIVSGAL
jgi:hypothetical protein